MSLGVGGTVAGGLTTPAMSERQRTGQQVGGNRKSAQQLELALAESGGLWAFRGDIHMSVIIHT